MFIRGKIYRWRDGLKSCRKSKLKVGQIERKKRSEKKKCVIVGQNKDHRIKGRVECNKKFEEARRHDK